MAERGNRQTETEQQDDVAASKRMLVWCYLAVIVIVIVCVIVSVQVAVRVDLYFCAALRVCHLGRTAT